MGLVQPGQGPASLRARQVSPMILMSITCPSRKWFSRKSQSGESVWAGPRACRSQRACAGFFPGFPRLPRHPECYPTHPGRLLRVLEEATVLVLRLKEMLGTLELPLGQLWEEVNLALQSLSVGGKRSPDERGRCRRPGDAGGTGG